MPTDLEQLRKRVDDRARATNLKPHRPTIEQHIVSMLEHQERELDRLRNDLGHERVERLNDDERLENRIEDVDRSVQRAHDAIYSLDTKP